MPILAELYRDARDLPERMPVLPLQGVILLPRAVLPLNIFEPRYLELVDDVLARTRVLAIVQPESSSTEEESPPGKSVPLRRVACAGRLTAYQELDDGRIIITLTGIARCELREEIPTDKPYRACAVSFERFAADFAQGAGEDDVNRQDLIRTLKAYLEARSLRADWSAISKSTNESLVNSLSMMSPYGPEEKQALLEACDLKTRSEVLVALAEMELAASGTGGGGSTLQ
ncbi:MAG: LON peptidase substrate-binding domain-containing protein [Hyphomicrobiaceae bacterium]